MTGSVMISFLSQPLLNDLVELLFITPRATFANRLSCASVVRPFASAISAAAIDAWQGQPPCPRIECLRFRADGAACCHTAREAVASRQLPRRGATECLALKGILRWRSLPCARRRANEAFVPAGRK